MTNSTFQVAQNAAQNTNAPDPRIGILLNAMKNPGIQYNLQDVKFWGVCFHPIGENQWAAIVASGLYVIMAENIGFIPPAKYFSYREEAFFDVNPFPRDGNGLLQELFSDFNTPAGINYLVKLRIPLSNIINLLETISERDRKQSRVVISPTPRLEKPEMIGRFSGDRYNKVFRSTRVEKPFVVVGGMPLEAIHPAVTYRFVVTGERPDCYEATITGTHGQARIGVVVSPQGFIPDDIKSINELKTVSPLLMRDLRVIDGNPDFVPHHLDANLLHTLLRTCLLSGAKEIDISLTGDFKKGVFISTVNEENSISPKINIKAGPLDWSLGPQRR